MEKMFLIPEYDNYDKIIVFFSGGKDSVACVLELLDNGVKPEKIELHHHSIDGREGELFMDWACTEGYCQAFADALGIDIYFSWKEGGFEAELLREDTSTAPIVFENDNKVAIKSGGNSQHKGTRLKFPAPVASLQTRWCSAYLKVDVGDRLIRKQIRFANGRSYLVISGERAEESPARAKYNQFEKHRVGNQDSKNRRVTRNIDHFRSVHQYKEQRIWDMMRAYSINPHPAYHVGFGRTSCMTCIFGSPSQWATIREYAPERFQKILDYEKQFNHTISMDGKSFIDALADKGSVYDVEDGYFEIANSREYKESIIVNNWQYPSGAFGENCGAI